ncbi:MAG: 2,3-epoxybenzoyl-CoA dihydrolase [Hyphomicrobiales bacterium]
MSKRIDFQTDPSNYKHWRVQYDGPVAFVTMDVDENGGLFDGYELKLNSYDLGVDIELSDIIQRMRFEHPEVKSVVMQSGKDKVFCAGANIRMLGGATHAHKVNFCKFTNETRNTYEAASTDSDQTWICAIKGSCAGGGYELALACDYIMLTDDSTSSVSLPELPLLAVLPGTGGLTRVTDKRKVRRDLADVFCTVEEGIKGKKAKEWNLVDEAVKNSAFDETVIERAKEFAEKSPRPSDLTGIALTPLQRTIADDGSLTYSTVEVAIDRSLNMATITISGPDTAAPSSTDALQADGADTWMLAAARELDDAILHLRLNELDVGLIAFKTQGDPETLKNHEAFLIENKDHWLANEILNYWKRLLKRIDVTSRSLVAMIENGSCFVGILAELAFACDRSYMMEGDFDGDNRPVATLTLTQSNFGMMPMGNDISRLEARFYGTPEMVDGAKEELGNSLEAFDANELGLVTFAFDDIDWDDEVRLFLEERGSFSPDGLTAMEANLRFVGPETMESRIFGRLTAWQNWVFQRPNAVGQDGALQKYGSGTRAKFDMERV